MIKGGGRAVMSRESQAAVVDLLMRLGCDEESSGDGKDTLLSNHERKRQEKKFLKRLVREYERKQLRKKFTNKSNTYRETPASSEVSTSASSICEHDCT